jgi:hypothetical protein
MSGTRKKQSSFSDSLPVQIGLGFSSAGTSTVSPGLSGVEMGHALAREDVDAFLEAVVDMRAARRFTGLTGGTSTYRTVTPRAPVSPQLISCEMRPGSARRWPALLE